MFSLKPLSWLKTRGFGEGIVDNTILAADGDVTIAAEDLAEKLSTAVFVDGDLTVSGDVSIDDNQALIVTGQLSCRALWIAEGRLSAKRLAVATVTTFGCAPEDMDGFVVDEVTTGVLCGEDGWPSAVRVLMSEFVLQPSNLKEEKLFGWIVSANPSAVNGALKASHTVDDAWCRAHKELVADPVLRRHLKLG